MLPIPTRHESRQAADCLSLFRLPGRLDARQTACLLGFQPHDIPVLITSKLLQPLGKPVPNAPKYFATCVIEELRVNPDWLDKASRAISRHWQMRNERQARTGNTDREEQPRTLELRG